jgi:N-acetylglucosaminyldiphosphoundecaprenol N-acetyl-beta-D-mannosaminyltransferase
VTKVNLYGVDVDVVSVDGTLAWVRSVIHNQGRARIVTLNATGLMNAERDPFFGRFVSGAELVVADGQPLVWASRLFGRRLPERVAGIDLVDRIAGIAAEAGLTVFLLGAEPDTVAAAAVELQQRHPGLIIAGHHHGFLGACPAATAEKVAASEASILFVGMGSPRQEQFIDRYWGELGVRIAMGVGGSFEVLADRVRRAPVWAQRLGLEWVFRMVQEPRRLAARYLDTFCWLAVRTAPVALRRLTFRQAQPAAKLERTR